MCTAIAATLSAHSQNVGIGTDDPRMQLHVSTSSGLGLLIENPVNLTNDLKTGVYFKSANQYYGAVKAIGTSTNSGRLGFFTYSGPDSTLLQERLTIADNGSIGIGTTTPASAMEVVGTVTSSGLHVNNNALVDGNVSTTNLTTTGNATVGNNCIVTNNITSKGLGVVSSANATQMKAAIYSATLTITNLGANSIAGVVGNIGIAAGTFSAAPTAYIGDVIAGTEDGDWYRVVLIPDNITTTNIRIRIVNPTATPITFSNVTWKVLVVGPR